MNRSDGMPAWKWFRVAGAATALGLAAAGFGLAPAVQAEPVALATPSAETLTLAAAVRKALQANPAVLQARARSDAARASAREAGAARGPAVEVREVALRTDAPADVFGLRLMQESFSFPEFVAGDPNQPGAITNFATEIQATMPLFTGGKLRAGIHAARRMQASADAGGRQAEAGVALQTATAYLNVLLAERFTALADRAHRTAQHHVEQAQDFFDAGLLVESDLLQARVQEARMDEHRVQALNSALLARAGLARMLGEDQGAAYELEANPAPLAPDSLPLAAAIQAALGCRHDLAAAAAAAEAAGLDVARARGDYWPEVAVAGKYAWNDDRFLGFGGESGTLMAMARWTPWNWGQTQARVTRSRAQQTTAQQALRGERARVEFEVRDAWQTVGTAQARQRAAARARTAAERALTILEDRFGQGVARITDVMDAETQAHDARVREAQAEFDMQIAIRTVRFVTGGNPVPEVQAEGTQHP